MGRRLKSHTAANGLHCTKSVITKKVVITRRNVLAPIIERRYQLFGAMRRRKKPIETFTNVTPESRKDWVTKLSFRAVVIFEGGDIYATCLPAPYITSGMLIAKEVREQAFKVLIRYVSMLQGKLDLPCQR